MARTPAFFGTTLGKKFWMALTGILLFLFLVGHLTGNLLVYLGPEALNGYAALLKKNAGLLWGARAALLAAVALHVTAAVQLTLRNWASRPVRYRVADRSAYDYAARTMVWSGPIIALYVVYHLLHFTFGAAHHDFVPGPAGVYANVVSGFRQPLVAAVYIGAVLLLGCHLFHGLWSLTQTLGLEHPRYDTLRRRASAAVALILTAGFVSIPVAVLAGLVG